MSVYLSYRRPGLDESAYLLVFIGSGVGGMLRHGVNVIAPRLLGVAFPDHTLIVNLVGSYAMGMLTE